MQLFRYVIAQSDWPTDVYALWLRVIIYFEIKPFAQTIVISPSFI